MHISYPGDVAVGLSELGTSRLVVARVVVVLLLYMGPYDYCSISSMPTCVRKLNLFHKTNPVYEISSLLSWGRRTSSNGQQLLSSGCRVVVQAWDTLEEGPYLS